MNVNALAALHIEHVLRNIARAPVRIALVVMFLTIFIGGALFSLFEADADYVDGIYWVTVVMPTVGFGDFSPETLPGRFLYVWTVAAGFFSTLCLSGAIGAAIVSRKIESAHETAEVNDDLEKIKEHMCSEVDKVIALTSTPRVTEALRLDHADRQKEKS